MFSAIDSSSNIAVSWWTAAMPCRQASCALASSTGAPATRTRPASGR